MVCVVNDLGGSWQGEGQSSSAADEVVAAIRAYGGTAVANYGRLLSDDLGVFAYEYGYVMSML